MKVYDLSLPIYTYMPVFPGTPPVEFVQSHTIKENNFNLGQGVVNTHAGTHTDAPSHFCSNGCSLGEVDVNKYIGKAIIIDVTHRKDKEAIVIDDVIRYEARIQEGNKVILRTDWYKCANDSKYFTDYPKISLELAKWLAEKKIDMIGVEPPSLNPEEYIEVHQTFLENNIAVVEGLAHLDKLDKDEVLFVGPPIGFKGVDGFPIRAVAIIED